MNIRKATEQDLATIEWLEKEAFTTPWDSVSLQSQLTDSTCINLVFEEEGNAVGYILGRSITPEAEIYRIATSNPFKKKGVGTALLLAFQVEAHLSFGVNSFFLEVRKSNTPARGLYEKNGYKVIGSRKNYYRNPSEDAILYMLEIKEELC